MDNSGFILLYRQLFDSWIFADDKALKIWIWCLLKANFKTKQVPLKVGKGITTIKVNRGQFIFGRHKAEEELFINGSAIYRRLQKMQEDSMLSIDSNNQYSIITITNYDSYQNISNQSEQPTHNQRTTNEQPTHNQRTQLKKDNKEKKGNNDNKTIGAISELIEIYLDLGMNGESEKFAALTSDFLRFRKEIKKPFKSETAILSHCKKIIKLSENESNKASEIYEQTYSNQWQGIFELKEKQIAPNQKKHTINPDIQNDPNRMSFD